MTRNMNRDFVYVLMNRRDGIVGLSRTKPIRSGRSVGGNRQQYVHDVVPHLLDHGCILITSSDTRRDTHPAVSCLFEPLRDKCYKRHYMTFKNGRLIWAELMSLDEIQQVIRKLKDRK